MRARCLVMCALLVALQPARAGAATINMIVNSQLDLVDAAPGNGTCAAAGGACTLRAAVQEARFIVNAGSNATILIPAGVYRLTLPIPSGGCKDTAANGDLDVTNFKSGTTIRLSGLETTSTIIDGNGLDGVIDVDLAQNAQVDLVNLTIRGGSRISSCYGFGGGVHARSSPGLPGILNITNCIITGNTAAAGGGVHNEGSTVNISKTTVTGNTATPVGIKATLGGGIANFSGSLTMDQSTVSGNTSGVTGIGVGNGTGGGIDAFEGPVTITNSTISGNTAFTDGGGLNAAGVIPTAIQLRNVTIIGNRADADGDGTGDGGGISTRAATISVANSIVASNIDPGGQGTDCWASAPGSLALNFVAMPGTTGCTARFIPAPIGLTTGTPAPFSPLRYNGGVGWTHDLLPGSSAVNAGDPAGCGVTTDERNVPRPQGTRCDLGAVEAGAPDTDSDLVPDPIDDCATTANLDQRDSDVDGFGDLCDNCPAASNPTQSTSACLTASSKSATIDQAGGTLTAGNVTMTVPAGALGTQPSCVSATCPTSFSITGLTSSEYALGSTATGGGLYLSVKLKPENVTFNAPVTLVFTWPDSDGVPGIIDGTGIPESSLRIFQNGNPITNTCGMTPCGTVPCCSATANTWTVQVTSFSEFAVAREGACVPEPLAGARLTLKNVLPPPADDRLILQGTMALEAGKSVGDVATKSGLVVVLGEAATGVIAGATLPSEAFDAKAKHGWKKEKGGSRWRWVDKRPTPPGGIRRAVLTAKGVDGKGRPLVALLVKGRGVSYATGLTPEATVTAGDTPCFAARFPGAPGPACKRNTAGTAVHCH